ncbi:piggyBac transposable element-derived protein 3-like [Onthophagus taurus]|uniref:piggyBac transposable element-derived protein 3-like n=1 Tax=Onthophagus taurus TaxID=166361 RepID=UPI0039BE632D
MWPKRGEILSDSEDENLDDSEDEFTPEDLPENSDDSSSNESDEEKESRTTCTSNQRKSSLKQYNPNKPNKWGYKIFVLCDDKGLIHNFEIHTGKIEPAPGKEDIGASGNIVLRLAGSIPTHHNYLLYLDNWFSSIKLMTILHEDGIYALGTIRRDRIPGLKLPTEKELKRRGRGAYDEFRTSVGDGIKLRVVQWFDNKSVRVASTFCGAQPVDAVHRFDRKQKTTIDVNRPNIIKQYNMFMGGVDLLDGLISYYRISLRSRRWYLKLIS